MVNTLPSPQVVGGAATQETMLRESRVPEANALPSYRGGPLTSDFGDWRVPIIEIGILKGAPCYVGIGQNGRCVCVFFFFSLYFTI